MKRSGVVSLLEDFATGSVSRRDFIKRGTALGLSATAIASAIAQTADAAPASTSGRGRTLSATDPGTLVIADTLNQGDWLTADPGWFFEIASAALLNVIYEPLYDLPDSTKPTEFRPLLAADFPEVSEDGTEAIIRLRQGVKFHNSGNELTADDVIFSWTRLKNIKYQGAFLAEEFGTGFEKVDDYSIKLVTGSPKAALTAILASIPLSILDSKVVAANGGTTADDADTTDTAKAFLDGTSAGTGPYKLVSYDINGEVVIEKNPDYHGDPAKLDRIIWRNTTDVSTQLQLVQTGEVDMAYALDPDSAEAVRGDVNLQLITGPTLAIQYLAMHTQETPGGPTANKKLRQAVGYAIDYAGIVSDLLVGAGLTPATCVPEPLLGTDKAREFAYTTDIEKAKSIFAESGLTEAEIVCTITAGGNGEGGVSLEALASWLKADIEQIDGVTFTINPIDGTERITKYRAGELQSTISPWTPDYVDVNTYTGPFAWSGGSAAKRVGYSNPEVDVLIEAGISELDPVAREQIYVDIMRMMIDDAAFLVLYQTVDQKPASAAVQGVTTHSVYQIQLRNAAKSA